MKRWIMWGLVALVTLTVAAIAFVVLRPSQSGNRDKLDRGFSASEQQRIDTVHISPAQLAKATCTDGADCWIAVDGVVYDMCGFPQWLTGLHHGVRAGQDDTAAFVKSGHAKAVLQKMPVVGAFRP